MAAPGGESKRAPASNLFHRDRFDVIGGHAPLLWRWRHGSKPVVTPEQKVADVNDVILAPAQMLGARPAPHVLADLGGGAGTPVVAYMKHAGMTAHAMVFVQQFSAIRFRRRSGWRSSGSDLDRGEQSKSHPAASSISDPAHGRYSTMKRDAEMPAIFGTRRVCGSFGVHLQLRPASLLHAAAACDPEQLISPTGGRDDLVGKEGGWGAFVFNLVHGSPSASRTACMMGSQLVARLDVGQSGRRARGLSRTVGTPVSPRRRRVHGVIGAVAGGGSHGW